MKNLKNILALVSVLFVAGAYAEDAKLDTKAVEAGVKKNKDNRDSAIVYINLEKGGYVGSVLWTPNIGAIYKGGPLAVVKTDIVDKDGNQIRRVSVNEVDANGQKLPEGFLGDFFIQK